jgi:hypothetical protein
LDKVRDGLRKVMKSLTLLKFAQQHKDRKNMWWLRESDQDYIRVQQAPYHIEHRFSAKGLVRFTVTSKKDQSQTDNDSADLVVPTTSHGASHKGSKLASSVYHMNKGKSQQSLEFIPTLPTGSTDSGERRTLDTCKNLEWPSGEQTPDSDKRENVKRRVMVGSTKFKEAQVVTSKPKFSTTSITALLEAEHPRRQPIRVDSRFQTLVAERSEKPQTAFPGIENRNPNQKAPVQLSSSIKCPEALEKVFKPFSSRKAQEPSLSLPSIRQSKK